MSEDVANAIDNAFNCDFGSVVELMQEAFVLFDSRDEEPEYGVGLIGVVKELSINTKKIAEAITPQASPGVDATGGTVASLTEAAMGITSGLVQVACAIESLAGAIRDKNN
jgi:hypothetical protein